MLGYTESKGKPGFLRLLASDREIFIPYGNPEDLIRNFDSGDGRYRFSLGAERPSLCGNQLSKELVEGA